MNKRQRKKMDKKLTIAIRELNDDVSVSEGFPLITDEEVQDTLTKVKKSKSAMCQTLNDYKRFILNS